MARMCYISKDLIELLDEVKEFGNFSSRKQASRALARQVRDMPFAMMFDGYREKENKGFLSLTD